MKSFYITTLGCKVNQYESDGIASELTAHGWHRRPHCEQTDVCIINTCAVTARAAQQSRQEIRHIIRNNTHARIVVTGCHAQTAAHEIKKIKAVDHIIGHKDKFSIARAVLSSFSQNPDIVPIETTDKLSEFPIHSPTVAPALETLVAPASTDCRDSEFHSFSPAVTGDKTRAYLKIQDGCNAFCTYCIVPYARGRSRSMPQKEVMAHLNALDEAGFREAIITGIHTGAYGLDFSKKSSFEALLRDIADKRPIHRIRLSSVEPRELSDGIINLVSSNPVFCDHLHIPLQSGDDDTLARMKRPYTAAHFKSLVMKIRRKMPHAAIGVDILQGFPGETEAAFKNTFNLLCALPITYLHVFPFSPREGTPAFDYKDQVPRDVIRERCSIIRSLGVRKTLEFQRQNTGRTMEGIVQEPRDEKTGMLKVVTGNYLTIQVEGGDELKKKVVSVTLDRITDGRLQGHIS